MNTQSKTTIRLQLLDTSIHYIFEREREKKRERKKKKNLVSLFLGEAKNTAFFPARQNQNRFGENILSVFKESS